jgi:hypothetical protein
VRIASLILIGNVGAEQVALLCGADLEMRLGGSGHRCLNMDRACPQLKSSRRP